MGISNTSDHIQTMIKMPNPIQDPPASPIPQVGLEGYGCSFHHQNQDREPQFVSWLYQRPVTIYQDQDAKPQSGTASVLQSHK